MSTLELIVAMLSGGMLAFGVWQVISLRRLPGLLQRVQESQCEQEYRLCKLACKVYREKEEKEEGAKDFDFFEPRDPCHESLIIQNMECLREPAFRRRECHREAERSYLRCVERELERQHPAYAACLRRCSEKLIDCRRKMLQDATFRHREELPSKSELPLEPPIPPIGPRP
jgi:hypothetical protein